MRTRPLPVVTLLIAALVATACGGDGRDEETTEPSVHADQTVEIDMVDVAFKPDKVTVRAGTTVRFRFRNEGNLVHDAAFGDEATQEEVERGSRRREGVELSPGATKDYVRSFGPPGSLIIGCHQPGHYRSGMKVELTIA